MTNRSNYQQRLDNYLDHYQRRYKLRIALIAIAALIFAALTISLFTAVLGNTLAYSSWLYYPARLLLAIIAIAIVALMLWAPWRHFAKSNGVEELESSVPEFQGRVETYTDMKRRNVRTPFTALLARDAIRTTSIAPVRKLVPSGDLIGPVVASVSMLVLSSWLFTAMPVDWKNGLRHLWAGWFQSDILPERAIALEPGDTKIRVGDSLFVNANLSGFTSEFAELHIKQDSQSDWETVDMNRQPDGNFSFRLYGVGEPLEYYVSAAFTKSERANVEVVIPAKVESIAITYVYPEWTGLEPVTVNDGADVAAIAGTEVELVITTDKPFANGQLVLNGADKKLTVEDDTQYSTSFSVDADGEYQIAELLDDDRILVTPVHSITVTEDAEPIISFTKPGRDWNATAIEEVTVAVSASDDYALEDVTLHYAINGGEWLSKSLDETQEYEHTFMLEEFLTDDGTPLLAGDLVTYYAKAHDREQSVSTDMLFIDIRPFERRFSQSQQSSQGGGGGQQQQEQEISQRQKEILIATWNLIRDQEKQSESLIDPQDSATLLSDLQVTLADQAETLAQRAEARQLLDNDPQIIKFVEYMQEAADSMRPSADNLASMNFQDAVTHQQRALQYLKRAESIFNDITISRNQSEGGGGASAGRDMAEMYELEMDLAKNQYETPDTAQSSSAQQSSAADDAFEKLKDLARRQQQLAEAAARNEELSMAEKWQQEKLRREIEELKKELEQLQRQQSASSQQQQSQQQQGQSQQSQSQSQSQQSQSQQGQSQSQSEQQQHAQSDSQQQESNEQSMQNQALQNLDEALQQLDQAEQNQQQLTPEQLQESLQAASERLQQSLEQVSEQRKQQLQERLTDAADNVRDLTQQQQDTSRQLRDALRKSMEARRENRYDSGLTPREQAQLAEQKRAMQRQLEEIMQQTQDTIDRFAEQSPETTDRLQQAIDELEQTKTAELLGISGDMIEEGQAPQAALRETRITEALNNLQNDLFDVQDIASNEVDQQPNDDITAADATSTLQQLRAALSEALSEQRQTQQLTQGQTGAEQQRLERGSGQRQQDQQGQQGESQQQSQQQGQESGNQQGEQGNSGQNGDSDQRTDTANAQSGQWGSNRGTRREQDTVMNDGQPQLLEEATRQLDQITGAPIDGISAETLADLREMAEQLQSDSGRDSEENDRRIEANVRLLLRQIEQIELQIYREQQASSGVRNDRPAAVPEGFDRRAADYFRRLSDEAGAGS